MSAQGKNLSAWKYSAYSMNSIWSWVTDSGSKREYKAKELELEK